MDFYLLVVSGVSTLSFCGGEAKRIQVVRVGPNRRVFRGCRARPTHEDQRKRVMKTIRRLFTRLVLETEAGLVFRWMWYRLNRRQDTPELEHSLRLRDAQQLENIIRIGVKRRGRIQLVEQWTVRVWGRDGSCSGYKSPVKALLRAALTRYADSLFRQGRAT